MIKKILSDRVAFSFSFFSVCFFICGIKYLWLYINSKNKINKKIEGIITKVVHNCRGRRATTEYIVNFEYDNEKYDRYVQTFRKTYKEGDKVIVIINPHKNEENSKIMIVGDSGILLSIEYILLGIIFATIVYVFYIKS